MDSRTVRISEGARRTLSTLAEEEGSSMRAVLEKAIDAYRRRRFLEGVNEAYAALRKDPAAWAKLVEERAEWDAALADGLGPVESWTAGGKRARARERKSRS
ncbi:MAG: toxin-antitoxin system protein [Planctomycetes bacterium]|nr:toxin-antitoxin system protein [Planctomycetota bacterium]